MTTTFVAAALFFGGGTNLQPATASDEMLLFDLSKDDSVMIEGRAAPEIKTPSSDRSLALSQKLKDLHARMYGAYWCSHCASQKELFGKEAFYSNNIEYVECSEVGENSKATTLCLEKKISGYPTWEVNGMLYSGERTLDEMEILVRMAEASPPGGKSKSPPKVLTTSSDRALVVADQLQALDAKLYGAYWCANTFEQKELLGKEVLVGAEKIAYIECAKDGDNSQLELCKEQGVQVVPSWQINGEMYKGVQDLDELEGIVKKAGKGSKVPSLVPSTTVATVESVERPPIDQPKEPEKRALPALPPVKTSRAVELASRMKKLPETRLYGASWCQFTEHQKDLFGIEGSKWLPYVECTSASEKELCRKKKIKTFPTWEISGRVYEAGELSLDQLETLVLEAENELSAPKKATKEILQGQPTKLIFTETNKGEEATAPPVALPAADAVASEKESETPTPLSKKANEPIAPPTIMSASSKRALTLATQLESMDTKMYGAYWCSHCANQKETLGKEAFAKIPYVECTQKGENSQAALCKEKGIKSVPVFEINGKLYNGERDLDELEEVVQAELKSSFKTDATVATVAATTEAVKPKEVERKQDQAATATSPVEAVKPKEPERKQSPAITSTSSEQALSLAADLKSLDAKLYGAYWCGFTKAQKERLGKEAFEKVTYVECAKDGDNSQTEKCMKNRIEGYPTWSIGGTLYPGDQDLDELEAVVKEVLRSAL